jgi:hypothetical protein
VQGFCGGSKGQSRSHCASASSERSMPTRIVRYGVCRHTLVKPEVTGYQATSAAFFYPGQWSSLMTLDRAEATGGTLVP